MIGWETAEEGAALLYTAIGELAEDLAEAVVIGDQAAPRWRERAKTYEEVGEDVSALARAIGILMRRRAPQD